MIIGVSVRNTRVADDLVRLIEGNGHQVGLFDGLGAAIRAVPAPALVFAEWRTDEQMPALLSALQENAKSERAIPVVVLVPAGDVAAMHRAIATGAMDALVLPGDPDEPIDPDEIMAEIADLSCEEGMLDFAARERFVELTRETLVGTSAVFRKCREDIKRAARCDANVLLLGETGTGKEMAARAIHELSHRAAELFVAVNCAAIQDNLLESELFGHVRGAFTNADADREGRFEIVGAGTLLLDEIGEMKPALQMKLTRAIEQRVFQRVGANDDISFHGRIVCATSIDLAEAVAKGAFRMDLFGRINQLRITLPPLRERQGDIPILARHFLEKHARGRNVKISDSAMGLIERYPFPMNIRELDNTIHGALAQSDPGKVILPKHLPAEITSYHPRSGTPGPSVSIQVPTSLPYREAREYACRAIDREYLSALLQKHNGNTSQAAEEAGIDRKTFAERHRAALEDLEGRNDG